MCGHCNNEVRHLGENEDILVGEDSAGFVTLSGPGIEKKHHARVIWPLAAGGALVNVADLLDGETGRSFRELNAEKTHAIPLGALVEVVDGDNKGRWGNVDCGVRLYVVEHTRDCDQTPLYTLAASFKTARNFRHESLLKRLSARVESGYAEENLTVVKLPPAEHEPCPDCDVLRAKGAVCEWCEDERQRDQEDDKTRKAFT
jgi:hypothetical protein